ncbi:MAG: threonine/homoserine/homoserine lactone efflux protein [Candidatus Paceibacteria bacterium]|jgi:threonine/homoserine/homoserine lactone efflux protein|tara:strand:- start:12663 stop:13286 length:624 start_codon:yes stop_codon:yes gene_type:complete
MTVEFCLAYFVAVLIFSITPGPGVFALMAKALKQGGNACWGLALGMTMSDIIYLLLVVWGLAYIANEYQLIFTLIRWCGATYLFYLAWQVWHAPVELNTTALAVTGSKGANFVLSYAEGMLISATNPKVMLFYIAFLPTFIDLTLLTSQGVVLVVGLNFIALMMGLMLIAYSAGKARKLFSQHKSVQRLNRITAGLMGTAGLLILTR